MRRIVWIIKVLGCFALMGLLCVVMFFQAIWAWFGWYWLLANIRLCNYLAIRRISRYYRDVFLHSLKTMSPEEASVHARKCADTLYEEWCQKAEKEFDKEYRWWFGDAK